MEDLYTHVHTTRKVDISAPTGANPSSPSHGRSHNHRHHSLERTTARLPPLPAHPQTLRDGTDNRVPQCRAPRSACTVSAPRAALAGHPQGGHKRRRAPDTLPQHPPLDKQNARTSAISPSRSPLPSTQLKQTYYTAIIGGGASIASVAPPGAGSMASRAGSRSGRSAGPSAVGRPWLASKNRSVCREWAS